MFKLQEFKFQDTFLLNKTLSRFVSINVSLIITSFLMISDHAFAQPHANDPLSIEEIQQVASITQERVAARAVTREPALKEGLSISKKPKEVLLIERHQQKNAPEGQRIAEMFIYDYERNELIESLVDLNTSKVISENRKQGVQLPLTENELKRAKQIVFEDEDERRILEDEYHRITSRQLTDTSELNIKAFTFTADSLPNRVNEASKLCGYHRCAQLMLYTGENIVFEITPIVNLSEGVVTQRIGF